MWIANQGPDRRGQWRTNTTDTERVYRRRQHATAAHAYAEVLRLMRGGHRPASPAALRDLARAVAPVPYDLPALAAD